jgi:hypothetical protein
LYTSWPGANRKDGEGGKDAADGFYGEALRGQTGQQIADARAQVDESADEATGPAQLDCLAQSSLGVGDLPQRVERQRAQGLDLDLTAGVVGAPGDVMKCIRASPIMPVRAASA